FIHFVPYVGSMFNGFSAPQNRWEYIVCLAFGGVAAFVFQHIKEVKAKDVAIGVVAYTLLAIAFIEYDTYSFDQTFDWII
ncbi:YfhO family protein, partial [Wenyingzhuangia sp. 2_MG-2023]